MAVNPKNDGYEDYVAIWKVIIQQLKKDYQISCVGIV